MATIHYAQRPQYMTLTLFSHDEVHLIRATTPEIIRRTWTNNKVGFGRGIDLDTWLAGNDTLHSQDFSVQGRNKIWILVPKSFNIQQPDLDLILSSVETYERPGLIASKDQGVRDVATMSIASVFTPERYRGQGYASLMMRLLWKTIKQMDHISFTFLYSAVGPTFYGRIGWAPKRSEEILIPANHFFGPVTSDAATTTATTIRQATLEDVKDQDLTELMNWDATLLRQSMKSWLNKPAATPSANNRVLTAVLPEPNCIKWLLARSRFMARHILKLDPCEITVLGVKDTQSDSFVLWHHDFIEDRLVVTRWCLDSKTEEGQRDMIARAMVQAAQMEAQRWNLSTVVVWNPGQSLADLLELGIRQRYEKAIPSLGLVSSPETDPENVEWIMNEKYAWKVFLS
ncbi:hypothetical protein BG011_009113 [Mortierella polycephala]|uniref:LYC1 C-terminal domain-containing protein n=1 Tax=Mortierella polycephala TaxID=41804 RepID=A0A9P6PLS1_9FUNG|nr:hypothetical protein BG011_009113 [Mortierella polycephala]